MRKLASIEKVRKVEPIEGADRIELAHVLGWQSEDVLEKPLNDLQEILIFKRSLGKESGGK